MAIIVWQNQVAQPWDYPQHGILNYTAPPQVISDSEILLQILDQTETNQGLVIINGERLAAILRSLDELKREKDEREKLYSAIRDIRKELLRGRSVQDGNR
jgi:hypothetical protein